MIGPISSSNTKSIPLAGSRCGQRVISLPFEFELGRVTYFRQCHLGRNKCFISKSRHSNALCTSTCSLVLSPLSSVQSLSRVRLFATPWTAAHTASLSITDSQSFLKLMSTVSVMSSNHLTHCHPLLLLPSIFPNIRVVSNESSIKKTEHQRIDAFKSWCWRRLLRIPWTTRRSNQSILKEIDPEYSLEGLMLKVKLQYFGHLMQRADSFEKTLMLGTAAESKLL